MGVLFVDTESDPVSKTPLTIQAHYHGKDYVWSAAADLSEFWEMWHTCEAVCMFNAPYDMGVLSSIDGNTFEWAGNFWDLDIHGYHYRVRRIGGFRNIIKHKTPAPPVFDLLKLWSILIDDGSTRSISLKSLIERELGVKAIHYSKEAADTYEYQIQDVQKLQELWEKFLWKTRNIKDIEGYTYKNWAAICTPATFCKLAMKRAYPALPQYRRENTAEDKAAGLTAGLERAYHGGITLALHRGTVSGTGWYDIHGAYAHAIEFENTDRYIRYKWQQTPNRIRKDHPRLHYVRTDAFLESINKSLKIFRTVEPGTAWMWSYDILALKKLFPDAKIALLKSYEPIPLLDVPQSKAAVWSELKEEEQRLHGKTTLREYYKLMSNTSYGITAQRDPYPTSHTNMVIAGIITSRARLVLAGMVETARAHGCTWVYSDTDSICVQLNGANPQELETAINRAVYPYSVECEHVGNTRVLSLKRYLATGDTKAADKIRLHGKSIYKITQKDILDMVSNPDNIKNTAMRLSGVTAATERTYKRVLKLDSRIEHPHPFMFLTECECDVGRAEWFGAWFAHIDTKATYIDNATAIDEYSRDVIRFASYAAAELYYDAHISSERINEGWLDDDSVDAMVFV